VNLTGQDVYQKGQKRKLSNQPSAEDRKHWERVRELGCIVKDSCCQGYTTIHHCGTRRGGRKDHRKVIPLCWEHHLGANGIDGKRISFREWQERFGTEQDHLAQTHLLLGIKGS